MNLNNEILKILPDLKKFSLSLTITSDYNSNDLLHDTIVKIYDNINKYNENYKFREWCFSVMHNLFKDYFKYRKITITLNDCKYNGNSIADKYNYEYLKKFCKVIKKDIRNSNKKYTPVLIMRIQGYKYKEISEKLNIPLNTVRKYIHVGVLDYKPYKKYL